MSTTLITGNADKAAQIKRILGIDIPHKKVSVPEIQSLDMAEVVTEKAKAAYQVVGSPVLVVDTGLRITALNGLPGPFVKFFFEELGKEKICRLVDISSDRSASIIVSFAYCSGTDTQVFSSVCSGVIAQRPTGEKGYGWDSIFIPSGYTQTYAELPSETKDQLSVKDIDINQLKNLLLQ